ncbi:calcium-transporting ATPase 7, plasma membrane-type-like [Carex rostrata]
MDYASVFLARTGSVSFTLPQKRWRIALTVIITCRTLSQKQNRYVSIDIPPKSFLSLKGIDHQPIHHLVKEKRAEDLHDLGGASGLIAKLNSDSNNGISSDNDEIRTRKETFGTNTYPKKKPKGFFVHVWEALSDPFLLLLAGCAAVSLGFGIKEHGIKNGWYDGVSIFLAVFLVTVVSAVSNFKQSKRFDKLASECDNITVTVVRESRRQEISIFDVVVGDVVLLNIGDQVPADGVFIEGHSLQVDESSMTGETHPIDISEREPFLTSGVKVVDGYARMLVTAVGTDTEWGEMMKTITHDNNEATPLQERLQGLTSNIGKIGITVAALVFTVLTIRYFTGNTKDENGVQEFDKHKVSVNNIISGLVNIFQQAVTIIVVAIPEGLPLAVNLTLAFSMKRMMKDNALVRNLSACETMGSVTTICTDKTGTLTLNRMTVTQFWVGKEPVKTDGVVESVDTRVINLLCQGVGLNTTGSVYQNNSLSVPEISGSPTEKALLYWAVSSLGMDTDALKRRSKVVHVEAFNSEKKRSGVLISENVNRKFVAHWKGAAEMILDRCTSYYDNDGSVYNMDFDQKSHFERIIKGMAASSLRCIAFACKNIEEMSQTNEGEAPKIDDEGLILLGLVGLKDPCRPEVKAAIEACKHAGVTVKMVTGDNVFTARAIAKECGIISENSEVDVVVEGQEFRNYSPDKQLEIADKIRVMARSSPFDKLLLVQCLKKKGHVVAVTGDGTNDAPALKEADVGLSMGIQGTEVAKESSDIVILDDNFNTVVTVMSWGRCVYNNIQKFIQFQLTVNVAALVINFISVVISGKVPLTTVQLLWVNLIMDTMGALALATDRPTKELMKRKPVGRTEPLITRVMWRNLLPQALFQVVVLLVFQFKGKQMFGVTEKVNNTIIFNTFVFCQVFNEFNSRKLEKKNVFEGILRNKMFLAIIAVTILLQVLMVEVLRRFAGTQMLNWEQWSICVGIAAITWPLGWLIKFIPVNKKPFRQMLPRWRS